MKITIQGSYYESSESQVDADGYNDNSNNQKKKDQDNSKSAEIEKNLCTFREACNQIYQSQRFQQQVIRVKGNYKDIQSQLLAQCEVVKDIINGSIVGLGDIPKEEISKWIQEIVEIQKRLVELENEWKKPIIPNEKMNLLKNLLQEEPQAEQLELQLTLASEQEMDALQKRIEKLQNAVHLSELKKTPANDTYFYKGIELIGSDSKLQEKKERLEYHNVQFNPLEIEPLNLVGHTQSLITQINILENEEITCGKLKMIQDLQERQNDQRDINEQKQQELANNLYKKYEQELKIIDELPQILGRLGTLKDLHQKSIELPMEIKRISEQFEWMLGELKAGEEILDILERK